MMKLFRRLTMSIFLPLILIASAVYYIGFTTDGLRLTYKLANNYIPGKLQIEELNGKLFTTFSLNNVLYTKDQQTISIAHVDIDWSPIKFLQNKMPLNTLTLTQGVVKQEGHSIITFEGTLKDVWNIEWQAHIPEIGLQSTGKITGAFAAPILDAKAVCQNIIIKGYKLRSIELSANARLVNNQLITNLKAYLNNHQNEIHGVVNLKNLSKTSPITGNFNLQLTDLTSLMPVNPYAKNPRGNVTGSGSLSGYLNHPQLTANFLLDQGQVNIPRLGVRLKNIKLTAIYNKNNQVNLQGIVHAGHGLANLNGTINLAEQTLLLHTKGDNFKVIDTSEYKIHLSPDLNLTMNPKKIRLEGNILVPSAQITPNNTNDSSTLPSEIVFVNEPKTNVSLPAHFSMQIHLTLGNDISIQTEGLKAKLGGQLVISESPGTPPTGTGELYADKGTFKAYGQTLTLLPSSRLVYTGNMLTNPGMNIRAGRTINTATSALASNTAVQSNYSDLDNLTVGVEVSGTVNKPTIGLFSNPGGLSHEDILSYLLFNQPRGKLGAGSVSLLNTALSTLTPGQTAQTIQKALSRFDISTENVDAVDPSSNRGLFNPVPTRVYKLRYQMGKHWAIQSETSSLENGIDLLYGFERD